MVWAGREVRSRKDYILGTDYRIFWNVSVRDPRHNSDHYLVLGCLCSSPLREHSEYIGMRKWPLLQPPTTPMREDSLFASLRRAAPKPLAKEARNNMWILAAMWRLVDERVSVRRYLAKDQAPIGRLGCAIKAILREDR